MSPQAKLDVAGRIKVNEDTSVPVDGMIRYTGADFEGRIGGEWKSLTKSINLLLERISGNATITYRDYSGGYESCGVRFSSPVCNWTGSFGQNNHWDDVLCKNAFEYDWKDQNPCDDINILRVDWNLSGDSGPVDVEFIRR